MKLEYTPHNMADVEVKIVTKLFEMLEGEGWEVTSVEDGGDDVPANTWSDALETIDSVEWSELRVTKDGRKAYVVLILGNGIDVVADYSYAWPDFDALMERHADWIETLTED